MNTSSSFEVSDAGTAQNEQAGSARFCSFPNDWVGLDKLSILLSKCAHKGDRDVLFEYVDFSWSDASSPAPVRVLRHAALEIVSERLQDIPGDYRHLALSYGMYVGFSPNTMVQEAFELLAQGLTYKEAAFETFTCMAITMSQPILTLLCSKRTRTTLLHLELFRVAFTSKNQLDKLSAFLQDTQILSSIKLSEIVCELGDAMHCFSKNALARNTSLQQVYATHRSLSMVELVESLHSHPSINCLHISYQGSDGDRFITAIHRMKSRLTRAHIRMELNDLGPEQSQRIRELYATVPNIAFEVIGAMYVVDHEFMRPFSTYKQVEEVTKTRSLLLCASDTSPCLRATLDALANVSDALVVSGYYQLNTSPIKIFPFEYTAYNILKTLRIHRAMQHCDVDHVLIHLPRCTQLTHLHLKFEALSLARFLECSDCELPSLKVFVVEGIHGEKDVAALSSYFESSAFRQLECLALEDIRAAVELAPALDTLERVRCRAPLSSLKLMSLGAKDAELVSRHIQSNKPVYFKSLDVRCRNSFHDASSSCLVSALVRRTRGGIEEVRFYSSNDADPKIIAAVRKKQWIPGDVSLPLTRVYINNRLNGACTAALRANLGLFPLLLEAKRHPQRREFQCLCDGSGFDGNDVIKSLILFFLKELCLFQR